jgi:hypothetical protein
MVRKEHDQSRCLLVLPCVSFLTGLSFIQVTFLYAGEYVIAAEVLGKKDKLRDVFDRLRTSTTIPTDVAQELAAFLPQYVRIDQLRSAIPRERWSETSAAASKGRRNLLWPVSLIKESYSEYNVTLPRPK